MSQRRYSNAYRRFTRLPEGILCFSQLPQSVSREDDAKDPDHAERPERPNEKEPTVRASNIVDTRAPQMNNGHAHRKYRYEQHDDVAREPLPKDQRPVEQNGRDRDPDHVH